MADGNAIDGRSTRHEGRRREILDRAIQYVLKNGVSDLSIRPMADAIGISHSVLLHHFGSKEKLVQRVLAEIRSRQLQQLREQGQQGHKDVLAMLDEWWAQIAARERLSFWRAFFGIYAHALKHPERHSEFLESVVNTWLASWTAALVEAGQTPARAKAVATLNQAACRGLIIDLLTTGDHARVGAAFKLLRKGLQVEIQAAHQELTR